MRKTAETRFGELIGLMTEKNFSGHDIHRLLYNYQIVPEIVISIQGSYTYILFPELIPDAIAEVNHTNYK